MRPALSAVVLLALACVRAGPSLPAPAAVEEFVIPWENAFPSDIVLDDAGRVWFTDRLTSVIGRFDPSDSNFTRFATPTPASAPYGFVRGPDGGLWYAARTARRLGRVDPGSGRIEEIPLPEGAGNPFLLALEGDRIWFTASGPGMYGSLAIEDRTVRLFEAPERWAPYGIAAGAQGVFVASRDGPAVLRIDPSTDVVELLDLSEPDTIPARIVQVAESDGSISHRRLAGRGGVRRARIRRMASAPDGRVWVTDFGGGRVLALHGDGSTTAFPSHDRRAEPYGIAVDGRGRVWYYERRSAEVVALDPGTGERVRFRVPTPGAVVRNIAIGEDAVWLPLSDGGKLGRIRTK